MPRTRVRKTSRGHSDVKNYANAYEEVKSGVSLRKAAQRHDINHVSLLRYVQKRDRAKEDEVHDVSMGYMAHNKVFNTEQERELSKYLMRCTEIYFGFSSKEVRKLAFELTVKYNLKCPTSWLENEMAGEEWFRSFMKRNPELSVRIAQAMSLSKGTRFNKTNVEAFYNSLQTVMNRYNFEPQDIYNVDEMGITTVQKRDRVVARRGMRQVGAFTSGERGTLVTLAFAANALGNLIPPLFIFPRDYYQEHVIRGAPEGSVGVGNPSGWMQDNIFIMFLKHFKKHANASLTHKVLLVLNNHSSHVHINSLDFCKENGIVLLSFPPHCSYKLQPLDQSVYGPFKKAINITCDAWTRSNPRKTMTCYDIPAVIKTAMPLAFTQGNVQAGFCKTGIYPFNRNLFQEINLASSSVTGRLDPNVEEINHENNPDFDDKTPPLSSSLLNKLTNSVEPVPETSEQARNVREMSPVATTSRESVIYLDDGVLNVEQPNLPASSPTLETDIAANKKHFRMLSSFKPSKIIPSVCIHCYPKAPLRKTTNRGCKAKKSTIYMDAVRKEHEKKQVD